MPLNQSSQLCLWSFHYRWYFHIKHSRKADPKTIIWQSCDDRETENTECCIVFNKKGNVDSTGDPYGLWLAGESCWFAFGFTQNLIRRAASEKMPP